MSDESHQEAESGSPTRTAAEWVTLSISIAILVILFGAIGVFYLSGDGEKSLIEVTPLTEDVRRERDRFLLPVEIANIGERTASTVNVTVALMVDGEEVESADFSIDFLAGGASERGFAIFTTDPASADVTVGAVSFMEP